MTHPALNRRWYGDEVVVHTNGVQFYFSTSHVEVDEDGELYKDSWVPVTARLPMPVVPRPGFEDGMVWDVEGYVTIFCKGEREVMNPHPEYSVYKTEGRDDGTLWMKRIDAAQRRKREKSVSG